MNPAYSQVLAADAADRRDLFIGAGQRLGTAAQNIEKDFWVCWTLDALFNGPASHGPRFLFKGGTSLSKGFGLIQRFSEDIDITVFREDIGEDASVEALAAMSGKKRQAKLDAIRRHARPLSAEICSPGFQRH
ncbi:MAG: nucleotidyl transferase AbiEii/AbiGii toxin family protein [Novosphingobium sp.]